MQYYHVIEASNPLRLGLRELWQHRELLFYFSWRDIKVKYKETTLGIAWVVLQPLVLTALFVLIFSKGFRISTLEVPYPVFVLSGLVLWSFVSSCLTNAANSMELHSKIIKKIYFPRLIVPVSAVATAGFDLVFGLVLLVAGCFYYSAHVSMPNLLFALPISLGILTIASAGLACLFSVLNAIFKDFRYVIPFFVQVLFFTSPVFYDSRLLGEGWWTEVLSWSPFSGGIQIFRSAFSEVAFPWQATMKPTISAILCFAGGLFIFKKLEPQLADLI